MQKSIETFVDHLKKPKDGNKNLLFDEPVKVFMQVVLHKIPNLMNPKQILW